ncbi:hypothetical protein GCM10017688_64960 [Streptomyces ramulosus]
MERLLEDISRGQTLDRLPIDMAAFRVRPAGTVAGGGRDPVNRATGRPEKLKVAAGAVWQLSESGWMDAGHVGAAGGAVGAVEHLLNGSRRTEASPLQAWARWTRPRCPPSTR